jgi:outer membrane lipoprotein
MLRKIRLVSTLLILGILSGCPSPVPDLVRKPPPEDPILRAVREDINRYRGESVRWGGTIASTRNFKDHTMIEIIARELDKGGRPKDTDASPGRFLARIDDFLEPATFQQGRKMTVYGTIEDAVEGQIGEYPYRFPVVDVDIYYLWERRPRARGPAYYSPRFRFGLGVGYYRRPFGYYPFGYW